MENEIQNRIRVNIKQTSKGVEHWDISVEVFNKDNDYAIAQIRDLKAKVQKELNQ